MNNLPLISIITPVFNVEKYIRRCIDSVLGQTYKNLEFILVDDGSTDLCPQICDEYSSRDDRIVVIHKKNEGQGVARNVALDIAKGDYVLFIDSDDYIESNMIEEMIGVATPEADIILCNAVIEKDNGKRLKFDLYQYSKVLNKKELLDLYLVNNAIYTAPWAKMIRAEIFNNIRFPAIRCNEDVAILHLILNKCNEAVLCSKVLYIWFIRANSTEHKAFSTDKLNLIKANDSLKEFVENEYPEYIDYVSLKRMENIYSLLVSIIRSNAIKENAEIFNHLISDFNSTYDCVRTTTKKYIRLRRNPKKFLFYEKTKWLFSKIKNKLFK